MNPSLTVRSRNGDYGVHIGAGLLWELGRLVRSAGVEGKAALISDSTVLGHWGVHVQTALTGAGIPVTTIDLPPGERTKTLETATTVYGRLIEAGFVRDDVVIAMGGGVTGDLAGFVAATFHRGMRLVQVPTTLLAQADSAIGGKVAVDHPLGKNLIGAFHSPLFVLTDVRTLHTLPRRERWNGLAEVAKVALISDPALVASLERDLDALAEGSASEAATLAVIEHAAAIKAAVVSEDEQERGRRMLLNFGHTLGHALEAVSGYGPIRHGEAVVLGMKAAVGISERMGRLSKDDGDRAMRLLGRFPLPRTAPVDRAALLAAVGRDKKKHTRGVRFIVLTGIGKAEIMTSLPDDALEAGVDSVIQSLGSPAA